MEDILKNTINDLEKSYGELGTNEKPIIIYVLRFI
jgi:hypothetical protein